MSLSPTVASVSRPLGVRMRPDLVVQPLLSEGQAMWVVKDPLTLACHRLGAEEFALLSMLDGAASLSDLQREFARRFAPRRVSGGEAQRFLARLAREGLTLSDSPGEAQRLARRGKSQPSGLARQIVANPLAIRFRGVDPEPLLRAVTPWVGWLFSRWCVAAGAILVIVAACFVLARFDEAAARLPSAHQFLRGENLALLAVSLAVAKGLHELGHAIACKRLGGECHEIGLMLLALAPCLYCDVSDSWMFRQRWRRAAVAAAGVYVELTLAAVCAVLWWNTRPGRLHDLSLNLMVVCSVGSLFFNANPLLRYDGYYVLSDLWGVPNLRQRSQAILGRWLARGCLGWQGEESALTPKRQRALLAVYALASTLYGWGVIAVILWALRQALRPLGLASVATALAAMVLARLAYPFLARSLAVLRDPLQRRRIQPLRLAISGAALAAVGAAVAWIPAPQRVAAPATLAPQGARGVYVSAPGALIEAAPAGTQVRAGDRLAQLANEEVELEIVQLAGRRNELRRRLENLETQRHAAAAPGESEAAAIPTVREALADVESRLAQRRRDRRRLSLAAPIDGVVFPPPRRWPPRGRSEELAPWSGTPLDRANLGCWLATGEALCLVGDGSRLEAVLAIDHHDSALVEAGQRVALRFDQAPGRELEGRIIALGDWDASQEDQGLALYGWAPLAEGASFQPGLWAKVRLDEAPSELLIGARGQARVIVAPQSLGQRLARWAAGVFRFSQ